MTQNIYVGNLSYSTTEDTLRTLFSEHGAVEAVRVFTDRYTGRSKGFAFVEMTSEDAAQGAITALSGRQVDEREIKVDKAKPKRDTRSGAWGRSRW